MDNHLATLRGSPSPILPGVNPLDPHGLRPSSQKGRFRHSLTSSAFGVPCLLSCSWPSGCWALPLPPGCVSAPRFLSCGALGARQVGAVLMSAFFGLNALNSSRWVLVPKNAFRGLGAILGLKKLTLFKAFFFPFQSVFFYEPNTIPIEQD